MSGGILIAIHHDERSQTGINEAAKEVTDYMTKTTPKVFSQSLHISRSCSDDVRHHHAILKIHTSLCIGERKAVTRVGFLLSAISGFDTCRAHFLSVCCPFKSDDVLEFRPPSDFLACLERLRTSQISLVLSTNTLSLSL